MFKWRRVMVTKPLSDLHEGESGTIVSIRGKPMMHRYLYENGLLVGCSVTITKLTSVAMESLITLKAGDRLFSLGQQMAYNIRVQVPLDIIDKESESLKKVPVNA